MLGLWVIVSPWTLQHVMATSAIPNGVTETAIWNHYVVGTSLVIIAVAAIVAFWLWEEWINIALGAWLLASPWLLGFRESVALAWNAAVVGGLVVVFAVWTLTTEQGLKKLQD